MSLVKLVICREDLPPNPNWRRFGYPEPNCWDIDNFVRLAVKYGEDSELYREARRIWWEMYWRYHGRYKRGRPLPKVYFCAETCVRIDDVLSKETLVRLLYNYFRVAGYVYGLIPKETSIKRFALVKA